jgi:hypothetical protein
MTTTHERQLRDALRFRRSPKPLGRKPKITVTPAMIEIWRRLRAIEDDCTCGGSKRACSACVETSALVAALRAHFRLENWQEVFSADDGGGHSEHQAAHRRYQMLEAAANPRPAKKR